METIIGKDIAAAKGLLDAGELVAIPTETVYGLAANALNGDAVIKIFKAKNRPQFNPLIIHLPFWKDVAIYVKHIPQSAKLLAMHFSPGPITFLLPRKDIMPDIVTAGSDKVAIRIPAHPLTLQLLKQLNYPLAAPSANPFGYVSPTNATHVYDGLNGRIKYILDGGECTVGLESTIVDFEKEAVIMRRNGGISKEQIESVLGRKVTTLTESTDHPVAPGQLKSHYATTTPLYIGDIIQLKNRFAGKNILHIGFGHVDCTKEFNLSEEADMDQAAKNLFSYLRKADTYGADVIITSLLPNEGIGRAINDRLMRAQHEMKSI
ncbi:L-threonylcarbamoyladenylate synthase [soil metagenome]